MVEAEAEAGAGGISGDPQLEGQITVVIDPWRLGNETEAGRVTVGPSLTGRRPRGCSHQQGCEQDRYQDLLPTGRVEGLLEPPRGVGRDGCGCSSPAHPTGSPAGSSITLWRTSRPPSRSVNP